jgi:hypothetical protein
MQLWHDVPDYWKLRDELASQLQGTPGVISVGIGRDGDDFVLVVLVEREQFKGGVQHQYKGVNISVRDFGLGRAI